MALSYIGGKSKIGNWIGTYIPHDIETYVEPFGGMFWVFFRMKLSDYPNLKKIIYNDFNPLNVNFFNCLLNYKEFYNVIKNYTSQNKELFEQFQKEIFNPDFKIDLSKPDFHTASKYAYILTQVWSGMNPEKSKYIDLRGKHKSKFDSFKGKLINNKFQTYLDRISFCENMDFEDVIQKYDSPSSYFYCDPPYYKTENYYTNHKFGIETHSRFANSIKSVVGKFSLSYYCFDQLKEWFPEEQYTWLSKEFNKPSMAKSGISQTKSTELLIMNYTNSQN
jgi:DNA adenine methylase